MKKHRKTVINNIKSKLYKSFIFLFIIVTLFTNSSIFSRDIEEKYFGKDLGHTTTINHFFITLVNTYYFL